VFAAPMSEIGTMSNNRASPGPHLHHRQVVIGPEPFNARPGWRSVQLDATTFVSHCPSLRNGLARDADGAKWMLLGLAVQTIAEAPDPIQGIARAHSSAVPELYPAWSGRWLLVGAGRIHLDASGLLGCFYGMDAAGRPWASTSPALLAEAIAPGSSPPVDSRELRFEQGLSWYPPPRSRLGTARRLLPSQVLALEDGALQPRQLLPPIEPERGYDRTLALLGDALMVALRRLPATPQPLTISLSAGLDSRVVLAAAERAGISFVLFNRISARMSAADRLIPPQLAQALGRELMMLRRSRRRSRRTARERLPLVMTHSARHVSEGDAQPLLDGARDDLEGISTGGWAFGVGKALTREQLPATVTDPGEDAVRLARALREPAESTAVEGLREWLEWTLRTPQDHLDWRDRFYIEQRLAGWQSSKEQVYDMVAVERFPVINSARCYALLLEPDEPRRAVQQHQHDLVERLCPPLAGYPNNPPASELSRSRVLVARLRDDPAGPLRAAGKRAMAVWRGS
jgi:hypothetical protein